MNRIPLDIVVTETGATTPGVLVGVFAADVDALEGEVSGLAADLSDCEELLGWALMLLREHRQVHGSAESHASDDPRDDESGIAQDWRKSRDEFLDKVGG